MASGAILINFSQCVAWTANFDSDPVSMDVVQGANPATVGWTSTASKTGNEEENSGWAKFDDIGSIGETARYSETLNSK